MEKNNIMELDESLQIEFDKDFENEFGPLKSDEKSITASIIEYKI